MDVERKRLRECEEDKLATDDNDIIQLRILLTC